MTHSKWTVELTMEEAARICCPPTPLISREPCESCADAATEMDTGAFRCRASMYGLRSCESYHAVRELEDIACQVAAKFKRIADHGMRHELAFSTADGFANALWEQGMGAEFNTEAFLELAGSGWKDR